MRASEFIEFINSKPKPTPRDLSFEYTHLTINEKIDLIRKKITKKVKNDTSKQTKR